MNKQLLIGVVGIAIVASVIGIVMWRSGSPPSDNHQSVPTKSNTQQVMDTVLGYLDHVPKEYRANDLDEGAELLGIAVRDYLYDYPSQLNLVDYDTKRCLERTLTYTSSPISYTYDFPQIQEDLASMRVYLNYPDFIGNPLENIFVFILKMRTADDKVAVRFSVPEGGVGWRITQYYLAYTEVADWEEYVR